MATRALAKRKRRAVKTTIPITVVGGIAAGMARPMESYLKGNIETGTSLVVRRYVGYDFQRNSWNLGELKYGLIPLLGGVLVHKLAGKLGINRAIASTGLPYIRL